MRRLRLVIAILIVSCFTRAVSLRAEGKIDFARDIRPILSDACFLCHGPDETQRKAELRLDIREGAFGELNVGIPFVPGKLAESEAWLRITADDPAQKMPPPKSGKKLAPKQVELIRKWIRSEEHTSELQSRFDLVCRL